ncbi:MutH/Sau3AI family endonuclease [uncultured Methanobrevibacter sp.]|uniref:MutH/Sau3AI family endonuclease n=1 Tax=uncultured Methanobrevibacter sp. TaxID=253161 RepID=UPI0025F250BB|nr:MutH/Sau3AI family endonuclease [uncultured Methanobrevibacter sp.]
MTDSHFFHKDEITRILDGCLNKTLGEVDSNNVFDRTIKHPKITGIAGDVIEQSVLGYPPDIRQEPDLDIDGVKTELKTTGMRRKGSRYDAKEPMSITAVSPDTIVNETFLDSNFWHKLEHMLFVYYLYDSPSPVKAAQYADFPIKGYQFHEFDEEDQEILKNDWEIVRDFIRYLQDEYEDYEDEYPRISHELRPKLMYIDTAPKWPNRPRFRLKRAVVSSIIQEHFGEGLEQLPGKYTTFSEIDKTLHDLSEKYKGKTIGELIDLLDIEVTRVNKSIGEAIIVKMFGGKSKKMQSIELFRKAGIIGKTITLTERGLRKEDMKFFTIDFDEFDNEDIEFEDSQFYDYFANNRFLCILFQKPDSDAKMIENKFLGFKMIEFSQEFVENDVKIAWERIKDLIVNDKLEDVISLDKFGNPRINSSGNVMSAPNFPKSSEGNVFVRGTSSTSDVKPLNVNGVQMYRQQIWVKGLYIVDKLNNEPYI